MTSHSGLISSLHTHRASCPAARGGGGGDSSVWILEAKPGQQIELTLIDFNWTSAVAGARRSCTHTYGYVIDAESGEKRAICGGGRQRVRSLYTSEGAQAHRVQLVLSQPPPDRPAYNFLIHYTGSAPGLLCRM